MVGRNSSTMMIRLVFDELGSLDYVMDLLRPGGAGSDNKYCAGTPDVCRLTALGYIVFER